MPSRQEQLQSYQFMVQRVVSALVLRETDPPQSPFRRAVGAAFASVLVTVIVAAGFGIYSVFTGSGNNQWRSEGAVVIDKDSAAVFVYRQGKLHPALNLVSALLASDSSKPQTFKVSSESLQDVPWGLTVGIPYLPDSVVEKDKLAGYPWSVCAVKQKDEPVSAVVIGAAAGTPVPDDEAMLVKSSTKSIGSNNTYLLWHGRIFETGSEAARLLAPGVQPTEVSLAFLNGLPRGQELKPLWVPGFGKRSDLDQLWKVGEIISVYDISAEDRYVVVRENDLAWVTQTQAALSSINTQRRLTIAELTKNNKIDISDALLPTETGPLQPPTKRPSITRYDGPGLCSIISDEAGNVQLRKDVTLNLESRPKTAGRSGSGAAYADYVLVPDGNGAVVASGQTSGPGQTYSYVSRDGVRYAAANLEVLAKLGYDGVKPLQLPPSLVSLLPEGPGLDPTEALVPLTVS